MTTPYERIAHARSLLLDAGLSPQSAAFDAEVLARHALGWDRAALVARGREAAPPHFSERFDELVLRRLRREPVAQILGVREFWGMDFEVTPDVLVPRPETEMIVEEAIAFARSQTCQTVLDVGTGTGCIAIAIARELPAVDVIAIDSSEAALAIARRNAARLEAGDRLVFRHADLFSGSDELADLIVSNPPYVPTTAAPAMQPEVLRFEPHAALFGGDDGLSIVRRLLDEAPARLRPDGRLVVEFGLGQEDDLLRLAADTGWRVVTLRQDLQGIPRTIVLAR